MSHSSCAASAILVPHHNPQLWSPVDKLIVPSKVRLLVDTHRKIDLVSRIVDRDLFIDARLTQFDKDAIASAAVRAISGLIVRIISHPRVTGEVNCYARRLYSRLPGQFKIMLGRRDSVREIHY